MTPDLETPTRARGRASVAVLFLLLGVTVGSWLARVPAVKSRLGLDDAAWGSTIVASTVGSFVSLWVGAVILGRVGPRRLVRLAAPLLLVVTPLMAAAPDRGLLACALVGFGMCTSGLNTPMNAQAVGVEHAYERPLMSSFHACYSLGTLTGALLGAAGAAAGLAPWLQLALTSVLLAIAVAATTPWLPADPPLIPRGTRGRPRLSRALLLLAVLALCAALAEGTASGWSAIYVDQTLHGGGGLGAIAYACFAGTMTLGRLVGDRLVHRLGRPRFLRASGAVAAAGLAVGLSLGTPFGACLGFLLLGIGLSCVVPTVFGAAGRQPGTSAGTGVATVTIAAWPAFLVGPPVVGWLSSQAGLRQALLLVVVAAAVVAVFGARVRTEEV